MSDEFCFGGGGPAQVDYDDGQDAMHCIAPKQQTTGPPTGRFGAFTTRPWVAAGLDPRTLANSYLAEYCNNKDIFGTTGEKEGFLSQLDSQQLLTWDNLTSPGAYNDM